MAPITVANSKAATMGTGSTVPLAMAIPAIINNRSPGANGTGTPLSSMKTSPAMTAIKRSPLRFEIEPIGFIRRTLFALRRRWLVDQLADQGDGKIPAAKKGVVEALQGVIRAALQVVAQLADEQLAERVAQIQRIPGSPHRLAIGRPLREEPHLHEQVDSIGHRRLRAVKDSANHRA